MQPVPQDLLKEYVQSQHFTSTTEIMEAMKEMSKLYASWAFFPRSAFSTAFHRVWRSAYSGGAWDGRRMLEQITPPFLV